MSSTTFQIAGKTALVTGSSRGLGAAIAMTLAAQGANVVVNYHQNREQADTVVKSILANGGKAKAVQGDIMSEASCGDLIKDAEACFGKIDILVINATPPQRMASISDYTAEDYQSMLDAFVLSPFHLSKAVIPHMKAQQWGRIINITSEVIDNGVTNYSAYVAAKGGQANWSQCMARELAPDGITVNNVAPGWIPVERHSDELLEAMDGYINNVPAGKMGTPEDVAYAVAFFASNEASFINGQSIAVNGANTVR